MTPMVSATIDTGALSHNLQRIRIGRRARASWRSSRRMPTATDSSRWRARSTRRMRSPWRGSTKDSRCATPGINKRTVLLEGVFDREQLDAAAAARFELVVHTAEQIELLREAGAGEPFKIWLKLDSGMNRLGFKGAAFDAALAALQLLWRACNRPVNLFTHLASADDPELAATASSWPASRGDRVALRRAQHRQFRRHAELSPGAGRLGAARLAAVRRLALRRLHRRGLRTEARHDAASHVIAVKDLAPGERVGYGGDWTAARPTRLAVAAVGYGDGYPRSLGSGSPVLVNGERAPLAGRVSMDMIGIDVTDLAEHAADWATRSCSGATGCRWRRSRCGRTRFRTSCCAGSASASR